MPEGGLKNPEKNFWCSIGGHEVSKTGRTGGPDSNSNECRRHHAEQRRARRLTQAESLGKKAVGRPTTRSALIRLRAFEELARTHSDEFEELLTKHRNQLLTAQSK